MRRLSAIRRLFAFLTILSFTFTQVIPAYSLREIQPEPGSPLRANIQAGLEEPAGVGRARTLAGVLANRVHPQRLAPMVDAEYGAWLASQGDRSWEIQWFDNNHRTNLGESDCRICTMRGNVFRGIPLMLHQMLTGGYDGAGIDIKLFLNGKFHIIEQKDMGHLDALIKNDLFEKFEADIIGLVAQEYGVDPSEVRPAHSADNAQARLANSFVVDPDFGDEVFQMHVGGKVNKTILIPMEGIGHTRWSTQGKPAKKNSHPFRKTVKTLLLADGRPLVVALAHNGNYESFKLVRAVLISMGHEIDGDTDSEILTLVVGLMHRAQGDVGIVSLQQAVARTLRFIKYFEDWDFLIGLLENQASEAIKYHDEAAELLKQELVYWGAQVPAGMVVPDLIAMSKRQADDIAFQALNKPWLFDASDRVDLSKVFLQKAEAMPPEADAKKQKEVKDARKRAQQRFFDPNYSSIAIAVTNNDKPGVVVARGRTGGDLEVYAPPLQSIAERLSLLIPKLEAEPLPADGRGAQSQWLHHIESLRQQVNVLVEALDQKNLILSSAAAGQLRRHQQRLSEEADKIHRIQFGASIPAEKEILLQLFRSIQEFSAEHAPVHDPGKRVAASERRAIPAVPGTYHQHPEKRFRDAGRGEVDTYQVQTGQVIQISRTIRREGVWEDELAAPDDITPDLRIDHTAPTQQMVDIANLDLGGAQSRLEREIANGLKGWFNTVDQFKGGTFPDLNYDEDQLREVEEWIFVAEGSSELVSQVVAKVGKAVPTTTLHFDVMTGKEFQEMISTGKLEFLARALAQRGQRIMVSFVSNTGQTETIRRAAAALNKTNQRLGAVEVTKAGQPSGETEQFDARALPCCVTNVAGSAVDTEVSRFDGRHHAIYTLVGYEMAVPATNSISVGTISSGLFETYLLASQDAFRDPNGNSTGKLEFNRRLDKAYAAARDIAKIIAPTDDGSLKLTRDYQRSVEDVLARIDPTHLDDLVWITGWWIWNVAAQESRLKLQEGFRSKGVHAFDVISGKHGPYAILQAGANVIVFMPNSKTFKSGSDQILQAIAEIRPRINSTEGGGKQGNLIVLMDAGEVYESLGEKIGAKADVIIGLPHMDDPFTGYMFSMIFMQLLTLYGARQRFEPIRQRLLVLDQMIQKSNVLGFQLPTDDPAQSETVENPSDFLRVFSETLTDPDREMDDYARQVLTELTKRNKQYFGMYSALAQRPGYTATNVAKDVLGSILAPDGVGQVIRRSDDWRRIESYARDRQEKMNQDLDLRARRRQVIRDAIERHELDYDFLKKEYEGIVEFSLSPGEAIRFADRDDAQGVQGWREYTETYVKNLSKQISGVEAGLEEESETQRVALRKAVRTDVVVYESVVNREASLPDDIPPAADIRKVLPLIDQDPAAAAVLVSELNDRVRGVPIPLASSLERVLGRIRNNLARLVGLDPLNTLIGELKLGFERTGIPQMGTFESAPPAATTIVLVGQHGKAGLNNILVGELAKARISVSDAQASDRDDLNIALAAATVEMPKTELPPDLLARIQNRLKGGWEDRLRGFLEEDKGRTPAQIGHFVELYRVYRENPGYVQDPQAWKDPDPAYAGLSLVAAIFPYGKPANEPSPLVGLQSRVQTITAKQGRAITPADKFVTSFRETEGSPAAGLVWLAFKDADVAAPVLNLVGSAKEFVAPYIVGAPLGSPSGSAASIPIATEPPLPPSLVAVRNRLQHGIEVAFEQDPVKRVYYDFDYDSVSGHTVFVIIGTPGPGTFGLLYDPMKQAGVNVKFLRDLPDHDGISFLSVPLTPDQLRAFVPVKEPEEEKPAEVDVLAEIARGVDKANVKKALAHLAPDLTEEESVEIVDLYLRVRDTGPFEVEEIADVTSRDERVILIIAASLEGSQYNYLAEVFTHDFWQGSGEEPAIQAYKKFDVVGRLLPNGPNVLFLGYKVPVEKSPELMSRAEKRVRKVLAEFSQRAGLEEKLAPSQSQSPLDLALPSRWPSFDEVVKRLNEALTSSDFLKTVRESLRQADGVLPGYRKIATQEKDALEKNGVVAENWSTIYVPVDGLSNGDAKRMHDLRLLGTVYLGHLKGNVQLSSGKLVPSEIKNSVLRDVVIGNNVLIRDNILVERYVIGDGAVVTQNRELTAERGTDFGLGKPIPIGPETGGREIKAYPEILFGDVVRLVRSQGDKAGQASYAEALAKYLEAAKADFGYIGRGAEVSGVADGKNLFVADGGVVFDNTTVHNLILLTAEGERSVVVGTSEVVNLTAQPGVEINGANMVMGIDDGAHGVLMLEHSHAGNGATIKDSVIAPNTGVEKGEATSSLLGPFIGMHHDSLVIGVDWGEGMGNVGAGIRLGSNHTGRAPDQEMRMGEGVFLGLGSLYSFSGNFVDSPYTIFGKGVSMLPSRIAMPFSLVQKPTVQIPGESPELMEISPAWIWSDNAYMVMRNEGKYAGRDKSSRNGLKEVGEKDPLLRRSPFEILRPDTVNQMIQARDVLAKIDLTTARTVNIPNRGKPLLYYTGPKSEKKIQPGEIPELGKTIMSEDSRDKAVRTYTAMIQYYGAKGLWAEVQKLAAAGRLSKVPALLATPSADDLRWEHERRVLLTELPGKTVPDILRFLVESQEKLAVQVRKSKAKDDERGERILDDYGETHTIAANDKFVKQSAAAAAKLRTDVETLLPQLGGLEEVTLGRRDAVDPVWAFVQGELSAGRTGVRVIGYQDGNSSPMFKESRDLSAGKFVVEQAVNFALAGAGSAAVRYTGAYSNQVEIRRAAGLEESAGTALTAPSTFTYSGVPIRTVTELKETLASVSRTPVPAAADPTQLPAFVVAPDGLAKFGTAAMIFRPSEGAPIPVDLIARDVDHRARVLASVQALNLQGFDIQVHDLGAEFNGNVGEAITSLEMKHWQAGRNPQMVTAMTGLEEIARFLGIPFAEGAFRSLDLVASNSNDVWS